MSKGTAAFFSGLGVVFIVLAIASIVIRIGIASREGRNQASADFEKLTTLVSSVQTVRDLARPEVQANLLRFFRNSPNLLLISIYERGFGVRLKLPRDTKYLPDSLNSNDVPTPVYPSRSAKLYSAPLRGDSTGKLAIDALYVIIPQTVVYNAFRDGVFIMVAWLIIAAIFILINAMQAMLARQRVARGRPEEFDPINNVPQQKVFHRREEQDSPPPPRPKAPAAARQEADFNFEEPSPAPAKPAKKKEAPVVEESPSSDDFESATAQAFGGGDVRVSEEDEDVDFDMSAVPVAPYEPEPPVREAARKEEAAPLFASGLTPESFFKERLESELSRASSFDQDLQLLFIEYSGLTRNMTEYTILAQTVLTHFKFKDLAFDRGNSGFSVILPNTHLDLGLRTAEDFLKVLAKNLAHKSTPPLAPPVYIGITSRSGRLVDANRFCQEAASSLARAYDAPESQIIAFHPDPEKYRDYLASRARQA